MCGEVWKQHHTYSTLDHSILGCESSMVGKVLIKAGARDSCGSRPNDESKLQLTEPNLDYFAVEYSYLSVACNSKKIPLYLGVNKSCMNFVLLHNRILACGNNFMTVC